MNVQIFEIIAFVFKTGWLSALLGVQLLMLALIVRQVINGIRGARFSQGLKTMHLKNNAAVENTPRVKKQHLKHAYRYFSFLALFVFFGLALSACTPGLPVILPGLPDTGGQSVPTAQVVTLPTASPAPVITPQPPTQAPGLPATSVALPAIDVVYGNVWHDLCGVGGEGTGNVHPTSGCVSNNHGGFSANGAFEQGEPGIPEIQVDLRQPDCAGPVVASTGTDSNGNYYFTGLRGGVYCVSVDIYSARNQGRLLPGDWTAGFGAMIVHAANGTPALAMFGWDHKYLPEVSVPPTPAPPVCTNRAKFVEDVTFPDDSLVALGERFVKTWLVKNTGTCAWGPEYSVVYASGNFLDGQANPLPYTQPGESIHVTVLMTAPRTEQRIYSEWLLQAPNGELFGVGPSGVAPLYVRILAASPVQMPTPEPRHQSVIRGVVWQDHCQLDVLSNGQTIPGKGCVIGETGGTRANGIFDAGEFGIESILVSLAPGHCLDQQPVRTIARTNYDGSYAFTDLQPGVYCISVEPFRETNGNILLPGRWTYPDLDLNQHSVMITTANQDQANINFGWDYQFP